MAVRSVVGSQSECTNAAKPTFGDIRLLGSIFLITAESYNEMMVIWALQYTIDTLMDTKLIHSSSYDFHYQRTITMECRFGHANVAIQSLFYKFIALKNTLPF